MADSCCNFAFPAKFSPHNAMPFTNKIEMELIIISHVKTTIVDEGMKVEKGYRKQKARNRKYLQHRNAINIPTKIDVTT